MSNQESVNKFLDEFLDEYFRRRPVNASFVGKHEYDSKLPDFSKSGIVDTIESMEELLILCNSIDESGINSQTIIDKKIAKGYLETQLWEFNSNHFYKGNPAMYTGEAVFSLIVLFLTDYAVAENRYIAFIERVKSLSTFFANAKDNIERAPEEWTLKAIRDCKGALIFLEKGLGKFIEKHPSIRCEEIRKSKQLAIKEFKEHKEYLEKVLLKNVGGEVKAGKEGFELMIRKGHFSDINIESYLEQAKTELKNSSIHLETYLKDFGVEDISELLKTLEKYHPNTNDYLDIFKLQWDNCKEISDKYKLVTWSDMQLEYIEQYEWVKDCSPYLYFLFYRSPAAFNRPDKHFYLVPYLNENSNYEEVDKFMRANNNYVIKSNHVAHHGGVGHHVQNSVAFDQNKSLMGKFAGCDCANRPAMMQSGTMIEGWAVYAVGMIGEYGFLTELEKCAEIQGYKRACCRAIVDIELHYGEFTIEDAINFYVNNAGMDFVAAKNEAVKNSMFPGMAFIYLYGSNLIKSLKRKMKEKDGDKFMIKNFHDELISYGSIPVALVVDEFEKKYGIKLDK